MRSQELQTFRVARCQVRTEQLPNAEPTPEAKGQFLLNLVQGKAREGGLHWSYSLRDDPVALL